MKILATLLLAFSLSACATQQSSLLDQIISERESNTGDHLIQVQTMPPGAIIDYNNDVVGVSPCTILVKDSYKANWPSNGLTIQTINARWTDGSRSYQTFCTGSPIPKNVVFLHPIPNKILPQPASLTQR